MNSANIHNPLPPSTSQVLSKATWTSAEKHRCDFDQWAKEYELGYSWEDYYCQGGQYCRWEGCCCPVPKSPRTKIGRTLVKGYQNQLSSAFNKWSQKSVRNIIKYINRKPWKLQKDAFGAWCRWNLYHSYLKIGTRVQIRPGPGLPYIWGKISKIINTPKSILKEKWVSTLLYDVTLDRGGTQANLSRCFIRPLTRLIRSGQIIDFNI